MWLKIQLVASTYKGNDSNYKLYFVNQPHVLLESQSMHTPVLDFCISPGSYQLPS